MSDEFFFGGLVGLAVGFILGLVLAGAVGGSTNAGVRETRSDAIEAGVAEYRADPATGVVTFEWKKSD